MRQWERHTATKCSKSQTVVDRWSFPYRNEMLSATFMGTFSVYHFQVLRDKAAGFVQLVSVKSSLLPEVEHMVLSLYHVF